MGDTSHLGSRGRYEARVSITFLTDVFPRSSMADQPLRFVSRLTPKAADRHVILGVVGYDPRKFAEQMNLNLANGWGIVRTIVDMVRGMKDGKYVLVKDPNKSLLRLYEVPAGTFEEGEGEDAVEEEGDAATTEAAGAGADGAGKGGGEAATAANGDAEPADAADK